MFALAETPLEALWHETVKGRGSVAMSSQEPKIEQHSDPAMTPDRREKLRQLFIDHRAELEAHARQKVGDGPPDPTDVIQQAFTKYASLKEPEKVENPRAFLYRTVTNIILDYVRRPVNRQKVSADEMGLEKILLDADEITPEIVLLNREVMQVVIETVRGLKQRQRRFMLLNRIHGMSYTEIARRNGTSISTAKRETEAAVNAIRHALEDLIDE